MKKVNLQMKLLRLAEKAAKRQIQKDISDWPPLCAGIYHQPKRPQRKEEK